MRTNLIPALAAAAPIMAGTAAIAAAQGADVNTDNPPTATSETRLNDTYSFVPSSGFSAHYHPHGIGQR